MPFNHFIVKEIGNGRGDEKEGNVIPAHIHSRNTHKGVVGHRNKGHGNNSRKSREPSKIMEDYFFTPQVYKLNN